MPVNFKQLSREAYCSAPPLPSSSIRPPRLTREKEVCRPRAPLDRPEFPVKAEVSSIEDVDIDCKPDVKFDLRIPFDPRQRSDPLQAGLAALSIRPSSSSSIDEKAPNAPGPSRFAEPWGI